MSRLREFVREDPGVVLAMALAVVLLAVGLLADDDALRCSASIKSRPSDAESDGTFLPIEESPVWAWEDGDWVCVPGGDDPSVCEGAEPPDMEGERE